MRHPVIARLVAYGYLIRLDKPIGTLLLLWPTWWALWLASGGKRVQAVVECAPAGYRRHHDVPS